MSRLWLIAAVLTAGCTTAAFDPITLDLSKRAVTPAPEPSPSPTPEPPQRPTAAPAPASVAEAPVRAPAATAAADQTPAAASRTETDEYTRYELLAPDTAQFRILYEVTATSPGATVFFNPIRKGSEASGERVTDRMTGEELRFEVVSGQEARESGSPRADLESDYIRVHLPRPVPAGGGQVRLLIEKTYKDAKSYFREGDAIVFSRPLGIKRNSVVLPAGYELTGCNVPSQVLSEADGRVKIAFWNAGPEAAPLKINAKKLGP